MYEAYRWCSAGRVLNTSLSGPTNGYPEWACCACSYRTTPPETSGVQQVLFYATHELQYDDRRLLDRYAKELSATNGQAQVWALLLLEARYPVDEKIRWRALEQDVQQTPVPVFPWTLRSIFWTFPLLGRALMRSRAFYLTGQKYLRSAPPPRRGAFGSGRGAGTTSSSTALYTTG